MLNAFLSQIEAPLRKCFSEKQRGETFAELMVRWQGPEAFAQLQAAGRDTILAILQAYPPLRDISQQPGFAEFIDQFLQYKKTEAQ